jgi:hypothetical protein
VAAVEAVLVEPVRRTVPNGPKLVHDYLHAARLLEQTLSLIKAKLYGESHAVHLRWPELWDRARGQLSEHNRVERDMVEKLIRYGGPVEVDGLARRVFDAETRGPTRPHPRLPHTGLLGLVARRVWAVADRFWDSAEGRVIPEPVHPAAHRHTSLIAQYLVADPLFDASAAIMQHRRRPPEEG